MFAYAAGSLANPTINFGIRHVGDTVTQGLTLTNSGPATGGYTEALDAALGGATAGVTATGSVLGIAAGGTSTGLTIGLTSTTAAVKSGTATLALSSDGAGIDGLGTTALPAQTVTVTGTIDNYAKLQLFKVSGTTGIGIANHGTVNLGTTTVGGAALSVSLGVINNVTGPSDVLSGNFAESNTTGFANTGFIAFSNLAAGTYEHQQKVTLNTATAGTFTETIQITGTGSNASGYSGALPTQTITVTGTIAPAALSIPLAANPDAFTGGIPTFDLTADPQPATHDWAATPTPSLYAPDPSLNSHAGMNDFFTHLAHISTL